MMAALLLSLSSSARWVGELGPLFATAHSSMLSVSSMLFFVDQPGQAGACEARGLGSPVLHTQVTPKYRPLAQYAVFGTGGDVNTALLNAGLLNVTQVQYGGTVLQTVMRCGKGVATLPTVCSALLMSTTCLKASDVCFSHDFSDLATWLVHCCGTRRSSPSWGLWAM
jgi:hypothetical protein